ncbi:hypothetical protein COBT_003718, partial [Conglomerata obtusa]
MEWNKDNMGAEPADNAQEGFEMRKDTHATEDRIRILSEYIKEVKVINFKMAAQNVEDEDK